MIYRLFMLWLLSFNEFPIDNQSTNPSSGMPNVERLSSYKSFSKNLIWFFLCTADVSGFV